MQIHNYFFKLRVGYHHPWLVSEVQRIKLAFKIFGKGMSTKISPISLPHE